MEPDNNLEKEDVELFVKNYEYALKLEPVRTTFLTGLMQDRKQILVYSAQQIIDEVCHHVK